jgi:hypothetical protein
MLDGKMVVLGGEVQEALNGARGVGAATRIEGGAPRWLLGAAVCFYHGQGVAR